MKYTDEEKARVATREVRLRKRVYPGRVLTHRMKKSEADYQIAVMEEIASEYRSRTELPLAGFDKLSGP